MANAYTVTLDGGTGPTVVLAELTPSQVLIAAKLVGREASATARGMKLAWNGVRSAVREVDGEKVKPGESPRVVTRVPWLNQLAEAWTKIHVPTAEQFSAAVGCMSAVVGPDGERWRLTLPDGRLVEMAEVGPDTVAAAISEAELSAGSEAAQAFVGLMSGPARAIRSVNGVPMSLADFRGKGADVWKGWDATFSVRDTYLLGAAFNQIHGSIGLGEVTPVALNG